MDEIKRLQEILAQFALERDWDQFHSPKNLAMALSIEASELMELFLWKTEEESFQVRSENEGPLKEELADVFLYLLRLASILEIDLLQASLEKIKINRERYPINLSKGNNKKHSQLRL